MKSRVTITLDPEVVRKAKATALARRTNLSALIEDLLRQTTDHATQPRPRFSQKWAGKLELRNSDEPDELLEALKQRYGLGIN